MPTSRIINLICAHKDVTPDRVFTADRHQEVIFARFAIWYHLHYSLKMSATQLSKMFGRSKANIFRGIRVFKYHLRYDKKFKDDYESLIEKLEGMTEATPSENMEEKD